MNLQKNKILAEFNENPFSPHTPVTPFSNGSEYSSWQDINCEQCVHYENESTEEEKAGCILAFNLDFASIADGTIPLWAAKEIGCTYNPLEQEIVLEYQCRHKEVICSGK